MELSLINRKPFVSKYDWVSILGQVSTVALDTESNGLERQFLDGTAFNLGFSLCVKLNGEYIKEYIPTGHRVYSHDGGTENVLSEVTASILTAVASKRVFLFNAPYDVRVVNYLGINLTDVVDLMRLTHLDDENYVQARNLDNMVKKYCSDVEPKKMTPELKAFIDAFGWGNLTFEQINDYATHDAYITYKLAEATVDALAKKNEANAVFSYYKNIESDTYNTLYNMKTRGVLVNLDVCQDYIDLGTKRIAEVKSELGFDPGVKKNMERVFWDELQLPVIMAKRKNGTESPTFDKGAMERYELMLEARSNKEDSELAGKILEYRGWQKAISSYYQKYIDLVYPDGRVRPSYLVHGTVSGRFACVEPNLQQLPKEKGSKPKPWVDTLKADVFEAREGYELWEFDYSQLEFRLGAHYANEPVLLDAFNDDDRDVFTEMSAMLKMPRQDCKTLTYSINYGAGAQRIMDAFNVDRKTATGHIQRFYSTYPNLRRVNMIAKSQAERHLKIQLWSGRYRHFQFTEQRFKAFNSFIQGGAADVVKMAMNRINKELPEVRMLLQVHDSLIFELPVARIEEYKTQIMDIMANPGGMDWQVHLKTDGHKLGAG